MADEMIRRSSEVSVWQASMRAALFNGVTESDIAGIIAAAVTRAKKGDLKAAEFVLRWTVGQQPKVVVNQQVLMQPSGETIDVTGPLPGDPGPDEIASRKLRIRLAKSERNLGDGTGG